MIIEWFTDPAIWFGLFTLVIMEIILGIDNLIFIAILADKLPPHQRDPARVVGLGLALFMRISLLFSISWLVSLTEPWVEVFGKAFSGRDSILLGGGLFLIFKAIIELHERFEMQHVNQDSKQGAHATFWHIIVQIIALDAVFSIDSVITAIGMVEEIAVMVSAVVISVGIMMVASKPLTIFVNRQPKLIVLCLGFLLMIGFSLIADGLGFHIPKGYLYSAIVFSLLVELFNQMARGNRKKLVTERLTLRAFTAEAVLRLLGAKTNLDKEDFAVMASSDIQPSTFNTEERNMIKGVLELAELPVKLIMTHHKDLHTINVNDSIGDAKDKMLESTYSRMIIMKDKLHEAVGFVQKKDILNAMISGNEFSFLSVMHQPLIIQGDKSILYALRGSKKTGLQIAFVVDDKGSFKGNITFTDIMEAIAGDIPERV